MSIAETQITSELVRRPEKYERLLKRTKALDPLLTAVAHPCDESSLGAAVGAARMRLISPLLVGPGAKAVVLGVSYG